MNCHNKAQTAQKSTAVIVAADVRRRTVLSRDGWEIRLLTSAATVASTTSD
jgi:hypothetical protein